MTGEGGALAKLRALVTEADPGIVKKVRWRKPSKPEGARLDSKSVQAIDFYENTEIDSKALRLIIVGAVKLISV